jgi:uncharacterized phage-associated protein
MLEGQIIFTFNRDKAIEAILYIANQIADPTFHSISKLLYFADKTSLETYGRFVTGDTYYAMKFGPVPSNAYDLLKHAPQDGSLGFRVDECKNVTPLRPSKRDELSESDIETLDGVIDLYGRMPFWQKTENSHDDAWQTAWEHRGDKGSAPMSVESIAKLLKDGDRLIRHLQTQHD